MKKDTILPFLKDIELFKNLDDKEFKELARSIREKHCEPGEMLFSENNPREDIFIILDGKVELYKTDSYGTKIRLALFGKGDFLGEGILDPDSLHSTSARAVSKAILLDVRKDFLNYNAGTTLKVLSNIIGIVSDRKSVV